MTIESGFKGVFSFSYILNATMVTGYEVNEMGSVTVNVLENFKF
jgi:hypothetical protein